MRVFRHFTSLPADARGAVLALGNFDGLHRGHQSVISRAGTLAWEHGFSYGVVTFEPHPRQVFRPRDPPFRLTPFRAKMHVLETLGCDLAINLHFDMVFAQRSAEDFVTEILHEGLAPKHLVVGYDFVFGRGRKGNAAMLDLMGRRLGFGVTIVPPVTKDGEAFSSTQIRDLLKAGDPARAAVLLGRPWEIEGRVEAGEAKGREIGFPTANIALGEYLRPAEGIYAARAGIERGDSVEWHDAVAYIGTRPTVAGTEAKLEVNLFDFAGDLYGQHLRVRLIDWIRPDRMFNSLAELTDQIALDATAARDIHASGRRAAP